MEKELNYTELGLLIKEFVEAQGEAKQVCNRRPAVEATSSRGPALSPRALY